MSAVSLPFRLVDVFARVPLSGNGLSVFLLEADLPAPVMQKITREMRQFETIFLNPTDRPATFGARIFTMEEELPFAGHPVIGAAACIHAEKFAEQDGVELEFLLSGRTIAVSTRREDGRWWATMDQGSAEIGAALPAAATGAFAQALGLHPADVATDLPLQVISTGLPYLIVPLRSGLERARIAAPGFEALLGSVGARFVYVLDVDRREGRTWDNDGRIEDIATGSAAGPAAAYLVAHGKAATGESILLAQGRFLDRPSELHAVVRGDSPPRVSVRGQVCFTVSGVLSLPAAIHSPFRRHG